MRHPEEKNTTKNNFKIFSFFLSWQLGSIRLVRIGYVGLGVVKLGGDRCLTHWGGIR